MIDRPSWGVMGSPTAAEVAGWSELPLGGFADLVRRHDPLWGLTRDSAVPEVAAVVAAFDADPWLGNDIFDILAHARELPLEMPAWTNRKSGSFSVCWM